MHREYIRKFSKYKKEAPLLSLEYLSSWIRTRDLPVMNPTSFDYYFPSTQYEALCT